MIKIYRTYENGYKREFTIVSARYANQENTAAVIFTQESAGVVISKDDTPDMWQQAIDAGVQFQPFQGIEE